MRYLLLLPVLILTFLFLSTSGHSLVQVCPTGSWNPPTSYGIYVSDFSVKGPSYPPKLLESLEINFTLKNQGGQTVYPQTDGTKYGVFLMYQKPNGQKTEFSPHLDYWHSAYTNTWDPNKKIGFFSGNAILETGTWKIWPSFRILTNNASLGIVSPPDN